MGNEELKTNINRNTQTEDITWENRA